jgi:hypothetical protein
MDVVNAIKTSPATRRSQMQDVPQEAVTIIEATAL